jgi:hypothetical protein
MQDKARKWIKFLRRYGPVSQNDNMYDEHIQRSSRRAKIRPINFVRPQEKEIFDCFTPSNELVSVILTGTAGDGKTHLCRSVWQQINGRESELSDDYVSVQINHSDENFTLHVIKDLSEWAPQQGAAWEAEKQQLMQTFCRSLYEPNSRDIFLIAANDGQLIGSLRRLEQTRWVQKARADIEELLVKDLQQLEAIRLNFFNLSRASSVELFDCALEAFFSHEEWQICYALQAGESEFWGSRCPIRRNFELLQTDLVKKRLRQLFELCDYSNLHIPIRGILLLLSNAVLGHPEVKDYLMTAEDIPAIIRTGRVSSASLYNNLFGGNLPETRTEAILVFEYLNRFRIGFETSNRIDNVLIFGDTDEHLQSSFNELIGRDSFYGANDNFRHAQHDYIEGTDESDGGVGTKKFLEMLIAQRRGLFFKVPEAEENDFRLWELTVFKFAGDYLEKIIGALKSGRVVEQAMLARLVKGLNRIFVGMLISDDRYLYLATSLSYSNARTSRILKDTVSVRPRKDERIEIVLEDGTEMPLLKVVFAEQFSAVLKLNLVRFEFLCRVAEGALPNSFSKECQEDILAFKSLLLSRLAEREELYGNTYQNQQTLGFKLLELDEAGNPQPEDIEIVRY